MRAQYSGIAHAFTGRYWYNGARLRGVASSGSPVEKTLKSLGAAVFGRLEGRLCEVHTHVMFLTAGVSVACMEYMYSEGVAGGK